MSDQPEDARARIRAWLRATREYEAIYEEGPIGDILAKDADGNFIVPAEEVPRRLFNDSPHCAETIQAYLRANGDPFEIEDYGAYLFRQAGGVLEDGTIDLAVLNRWEAQYREALSMLPGLQSKLDAVRAAQVNLEKVKTENKARREYLELSPAMLFVDHDPMTATGKLFELPDTTAAMHALLERMDGNQEAIDGLRKAVMNYVRDKIGVTNDRAAEYLAFMEGHWQALAVLFDETRMKTFRSIGADLRRCLPPASVPISEIRERLPITVPRRGWWRLFGR
ncbi:MAG: hypothetical protein P4M05_27260 [Bradyrhizobium sp.]|nr:hypothetical protein [Bradyrhizobium sp.]